MVSSLYCACSANHGEGILLIGVGYLLMDENIVQAIIYIYSSVMDS